MKLSRSYQYAYHAKSSIDYFSETKNLEVLQVYLKSYLPKEIMSVSFFYDTCERSKLWLPKERIKLEKINSKSCKCVRDIQ